MNKNIPNIQVGDFIEIEDRDSRKNNNFRVLKVQNEYKFHYTCELIPLVKRAAGRKITISLNKSSILTGDIKVTSLNEELKIMAENGELTDEILRAYVLDNSRNKKRKKNISEMSEEILEENNSDEELDN